MSDDYKLKVFLGGLSFETDENKVREHFTQYGNITDVIIMRDPVSSKSRGFGFITFDESRSVDSVMENRPHMLDGRDVEPKRAIPRDKQTGPTGGMAGKITKVFVGGIKDQTTEGDLQSYFSQYGAIDGVELVRDRDTQKKRGFAFVNFLEWEAVDKACEMKYHNVNGVQVELKKARTKSELITGNFAGEVRNSSDIAQQLTQYNNLSYGQLYGQQQQFGQQLYNQQVAYNQQGVYNQANQFQNYGYGYDYQAMYGGLMMPGGAMAVGTTASVDPGNQAGDQVSMLQPTAVVASAQGLIGHQQAGPGVAEAMDNNAFSVPPPALMQTLPSGVAQPAQTALAQPGVDSANPASTPSSSATAPATGIPDNANQMQGNNQCNNPMMNQMQQQQQSNNAGSMQQGMAQQSNQSQPQQIQPWEQQNNQGLGQQQQPSQLQQQQQFNSMQNQISGVGGNMQQINQQNQNGGMGPSNNGQQWNNANGGGAQKMQAQKSFGSNYDGSFSGGPQRSNNFNQKSSGPYGGGYGQNQPSSAGDSNGNYSRR